MRIINFGLNEGSGFWRVRIPLGALNQHGHQCIVSQNAMNEFEMEKFDVVYIKNVIDELGIAGAMMVRKLRGLRIAIDIDDDLVLNEDHPLRVMYEKKKTTFIQQQTLKIADVVTCTTQELAEKLEKYNKNIHVIPNCYEHNWFNVRQRTHDGKLRIGWAGGGTHYNDLSMLSNVVRKIREKYDVEFVARGELRIKSIWGEDTEYFPSVAIEYYPEALASMAIDIGLCPLEDNGFNKSKSPIKFYEYSLLGIPSVCSPTVYGKLPVTTIAKTEEEWVEELSKLIENPELRKKRGAESKKYIEDNFNINDHWKKWEEAFGTR